jgi:hypothetical protein
MDDEKRLADAQDRLTCAERRLYLARIDRDEARSAMRRAKENLQLARQALKEAGKR